MRRANPQPEVVRESLRDADPKGRVDVAMYRGAEKIAKHCGAEKLWDGGLGDIVENIIQNLGVRSTPITPHEIVREIGIGGRRR